MYLQHSCRSSSVSVDHEWELMAVVSSKWRQLWQVSPGRKWQYLPRLVQVWVEARWSPQWTPQACAFHLALYFWKAEITSVSVHPIHIASYDNIIAMCQTSDDNIILCFRFVTCVTLFEWYYHWRSFVVSWDVVLNIHTALNYAWPVYVHVSFQKHTSCRCPLFTRRSILVESKWIWYVYFN